MKKVLGNNTVALNQKKKRLCVRIPDSMLLDIKHTLANNSVSIKSRSKWISEAIFELLISNNYIDYVSEEWIEPGKNSILEVTLDKKAENALK